MMVLAMKKPVSKLVDLEIDEVSVVDRGANQHSLIAFSKSLAAGAYDAEDGMSATFIDENGIEVGEEDLEVGDIVVDEDGNEYEIVLEDDVDGVEKNAASEFALRRLDDAIGAYDKGKKAMGGAYDKGRKAGRLRYRQGRYMASSAYGSARDNVSRNRLAYGMAGAGAAGAGMGAAGGIAYERTKKSLGDDILDEFSKALTDRDREVVFAKMANEVKKAHATAEEAMSWAEAEHDARLTEVFISKAAEYNLPVDAEVFGPILKSIAQTLDDEDLEVLDALFHAIGDALYDEIGYVGESSNSSVLDQVNAYADDLVTKADVSHAQAMTAMFETNPTAYDAYIAEMGR